MEAEVLARPVCPFIYFVRGLIIEYISCSSPYSSNVTSTSTSIADIKEFGLSSRLSFLPYACPFVHFSHSLLPVFVNSPTSPPPDWLRPFCPPARILTCLWFIVTALFLPHFGVLTACRCDPLIGLKLDQRTLRYTAYFGRDLRGASNQDEESFRRSDICPAHH